LIGKTELVSQRLPADRQDILSFVQGQVDEVHRALTAQMKRLASLRDELEELRANVACLADSSS
jgi:NTP pyrophosphatase (non-canonical NTP hydrolase)